MAGAGMTVREAGQDDVARVVELGRAFFEYSPWSEFVSFSAKDTERTVGHLIESPDGVVFLSDRGIIGGLIFPLYFNAAYRIAQELFWYANGPDGAALRQAFERWAKDWGANAIQCSCLADEREPAVRRLYRKAGYRPTELSLLREVA